MTKAGIDRKVVIPGVVLEGAPLFSSWPYAIYLGYRETPPGEEVDLRHYFIVNEEYQVIEGSTPRIIMARAALRELAKEYEDFHKQPEQQTEIKEWTN